MTNTVEQHFIHVRAKTNARVECIEEKQGKYFIHVKEKAVQGKANKRIQQLLAQVLHCNPRELRLVKGGTTPSKTFLFTNHTHHENKL